MKKIYNIQDFKKGVRHMSKVKEATNATNPEEKAKEVLANNTNGSIPVNPVIIAQNNHISVKYAEFTEPNISGMLEITNNDEATIYVKHNDHTNRKRFTIAHELGHYFLHYTKNNLYVDRELSFFRNNPDFSSRDIEIEANKFAAALLMPADRVKREWEIRKNPTVDELAALFGVSISAMGNRIINIGINRG
ncbi:ImmA/IrrE family metallo-endopeptidase [Neobacillus sp. Marseille-QA0830]